MGEYVGRWLNKAMRECEHLFGSTMVEGETSVAVTTVSVNSPGGMLT